MSTWQFIKSQNFNFERYNSHSVRNVLKVALNNSDLNSIRKAFIYDKFYIAIAKELIIFNESCTKQLYSITLESLTNCFCVSPNRKYIIICLNNGNVILADNITGNLINSCFALQNIVSCFVQDFDEYIYVYVINDMGKCLLLQLSNNVSELSEMFDLRNQINCACMKQNYIIISINMHLYVYNIVSKQGYFVNIFQDLIKLYYIEKSMLLGITSRGNLVHVDINTYTIHYSFPESYIDINLITDKEYVEYLYLLKEDNNRKNSIEIRKLKDFEQVFSIDIKQNVVLIPSNNLLNYICIGDTTGEAIISQVQKTTPSECYNAYIKQKQYAEAEIYAKEFNLNLDLLIIAKIDDIVAKEHCSCLDSKAFLALLNSMEGNMEYKLENLVIIIKKVHENIENLIELFVAVSNLIETIDEIAPGNIKLHINELNMLHYKFNAFSFILKNNTYKLEEWTDFHNRDLLDELVLHVHKDNFEAASIICMQLDTEHIKRISSNMIRQLLDLINFEHINSKLFYSLSSIIVNYFPNTLDEFSVFYLKMITDAERNSKSFPEDMLTATTNLIKLTKGINNELICSFASTLNGIKKVLCDIEDIYSKLKITVTFEDASKDSRKLIKDLIHDKSVKSDLLIDYAYEYITRNSFDVNAIFMEEISVLMYEDTVDKIIIMLNYLTDIESKHEIVFNLLLHVYSWTDEVRKLANSYKKYSKKIENYLKSEDLFDVFYKYQFEDMVDVYDEEDVIFATKRILYCNKLNMLDDVYKLCIYDEYKRKVNFTIADYFLNNNKPIQLLEWLKTMSNEDGCVVCSYISQINSISFLYSDGEYFNVDLMKSIYEIYRAISPTHSRNYIKNEFETYKNLKKIKEKFGLTIKLGELNNKIARDNIYNELLLCTINDFEMNLHVIINLIDLISKTFNYSRESVLVKYCEMVSDCEIICKLMKYMCETSNFECLWDMVLILMKETLKNNSDEYTLLDLSINVQTNHNVEDLKQNLITICNFITKAFLSTNKDLLNSAELAMWFHPLSYFLRKSPETNFQICSQYTAEIPMITINSFKIFREIFLRYMSFRGEYLGNCHRTTDMSKDNLKRDLNELRLAIFNMCDDGLELLAYHITCNLETLFSRNLDNDLLKYINENLSKPVINILSKRILKTDNVDYYFLSSLIIKNCPNIWQFLHTNLKRYRNDYTKFKYIANLGCKLVNHLDVQQYSFCKYLLLTCKWWEKNKNSNCIHYADLCTKPPMKVLTYFLENNLISTNDLNEFSKDFNLPLENCLMLNLNMIIINWNPVYEILCKPTGKILSMKNDEEELYEKCVYIINKIENKIVLLNQLRELYKKVNIYYYEAYLCILRIINLLEPSQDVINKETLLRFLVKFRRVSEPLQTEYSENSQNHYELLKFRIPYVETFFSHKVFNFIKKEINLDTYRMWFEVLPILNHVTIDDLCIEALRNIELPEVQRKCSFGECQYLVEQITFCVNYITKKEPAISVLYYLVNKMANGVDKLYMAELCYKLISDYQDSASLDLKEIHEVKTQISKLYKTCKIRNILTDYQLNDHIYLEKITDPCGLIVDLYKDKKIITSETSAHDINKCAEEIANFSEIHIINIRISLVQELLETETEIIFEKSANMLRLLYIFKSGCIEMWQKYLLEIFKEPKYDTFYKAKALECLYFISDNEYFEMNTGIKLSDLKKHTNKLIILHKLTNYGFAINTIEELDLHRKSKICFIINRSKLINSHRLMALLCLTYEIYDKKFWKAIFKLAINSQSWENLLYYLKTIRLKINWYNDKFYVEAWQITAENWFNWQCLDNKDLIMEYSLLIHSCPVIAKLNLDHLVNELCLRKNYVQAALLLNYCNEERQKYYSKIILNNVNNIMIKLESEIKNNCFYNIDTIKSILKKYQSV